MKFRMFLPLVFMFILSVPSETGAGNFSMAGSSWLGGGLSFSSFGFEGSDTRRNTLQMSPILRFFPIDHFMIGPIISWNGTFLNGSNANQFDFGAEAGCVLSSDSKVFTYFRSGGSVTILGGNALADSYNGFSLPMAAGLVVSCGDNIGIQIEPMYTITWIEKSSMNYFGINIGICGIGNRSAVSIMQGFSVLNRLF